LVSTVAPPGAGGRGRRCTITPTRAAASSVRALRASVVEWDECGQAWTAHILASGTMLGPFTTRAEAVSAERAILATRLDAALDHHAGPLAPPRAHPVTSDQGGESEATHLEPGGASLRGL
jgi:hypothetical protein